MPPSSEPLDMPSLFSDQGGPGAPCAIPQWHPPLTHGTQYGETAFIQQSVKLHQLRLIDFHEICVYLNNFHAF